MSYQWNALLWEVELSFSLCMYIKESVRIAANSYYFASSELSCKKKVLNVNFNFSENLRTYKGTESNFGVQVGSGFGYSAFLQHFGELKAYENKSQMKVLQSTTRCSVKFLVAIKCS